MDPISNDRYMWVEARIFLLGRMINELTARPNRYASSHRQVNAQLQTLQNMCAEQLQLNLEKNCIEEYFAERQERQEP